MADFTPVALGVKPPQGMSLSELLNMANQVQQYQQAQQINPLQVQRAQMEIEQAQKMNPVMLKKATIEADKAQADFYANFAEKARGVYGGLVNDPDFISGNAKGMEKKLQESNRFLNSIGVPSHPDGMGQQLVEMAKTDPKAVRQYLKNMIQGGLGAQGQQNLQTPQLTEIAGQPATYEAATGTARPLNIGGQPAAQPAAQPAPQPAGQPVQPMPPREQGVTRTQMELPYPVRRAGDIRPLAPNEVKDQAYGQAYRENLSSQTLDLIPLRRNVNEVLKTARDLGANEWNQGAGVIGKAGRELSMFLGTEQGKQYKMLSKELANVQMASMKALGMKTDADKTLNAAANGDYTYPPENLEKIAMQTQGNITNLELQSKGAQAFAKKYGDANLQKFQDLWATNGKDSRVFDAIAINESDLPQEEKVRKIDKLFEGLSAKEINERIKRKNNLLKLSATGEL